MNHTPTLYVDGGCIGRNPSPLGGTWAWCLVDDWDKRIACDEGLILPGDVGMPTVSNNVAELVAAVKGLEAAPLGWAGVIWTDSKVTWWRLTTSWKFNGVPDDLRRRCIMLRTNRPWTPMLLAGHPTRKDLEIGCNEKGRFVSRHNVWCDERCNALAERFLQSRGIA